MNLRPSGYEPDELPGCSTPRQGFVCFAWREQIVGFTGLAVIDAFGLMGSEKVAFTWNKYIGMALMIGGVLLFKWKS